jgi:hypothetical protein
VLKILDVNRIIPNPFFLIMGVNLFRLQFLPRTKFYVLNPVLCVLARKATVSRA